MKNKELTGISNVKLGPSGQDGDSLPAAALKLNAFIILGIDKDLG